MKRLWGVLFIVSTVCCVFTAHFYFKEKKPVVSVVMSTYNRANLVKRAIDSVLNQTFNDLELIVINDGSKDNTDQVLTEYAKKDHRVVYLKNSQNKGLIYSLDRGLKAARGDYIARIDDDDEMLETRLENQVEYMKNNPTAAVLATEYYAYKEKEVEKGKKVRYRVQIGCPTPPEQVHINLHFGNGVAHPTTMIRRSFLVEHQLEYRENYKSAEDYKLWSEVVANKGEIHCLKKPLTEYTRAGDNPSSFYSNMVKTSKKVQREMQSRFVDDPNELEGLTKCEIAKKMVKANLKKKILDQKRLEDLATMSCPPEGDNLWKIDHPYWIDYFIFSKDKKKITRYYNRTQTARVKSFKGKKLVIDWDEWGDETFICDRKTKTCVLKEKEKR